MKRSAQAADRMRDRFEIARQATNWSKRDLSLRAGLSPAHYGLILSRRGGSVEMATAEAIAAAFAKEGFSQDWLLFGQGEMRGVAKVVPEAVVYGKFLSAVTEYLTHEVRKLYQEEGVELAEDVEDDVVGDAIDAVEATVAHALSGQRTMLRNVQAHRERLEAAPAPPEGGATGVRPPKGAR